MSATKLQIIDITYCECKETLMLFSKNRDIKELSNKSNISIDSIEQLGYLWDSCVNRQIYFDTHSKMKWGRCVLATNVWQSAKNNVVIPKGFVCDIEYECSDTKKIKMATSVLSEYLTDLKEPQKNRWFNGKPISINVTGVAEGWAYTHNVAVHVTIGG